MNDPSLILALGILVIVTIGISLTWLGLRFLKAERSPFLKIFKDAVAICSRDPKLLFLPFLAMICFCPLFIGIIRYIIIVYPIWKSHANWKPFGATIILGPAVGLSVVAGCFMCTFDAILADYVLNFEKGVPAGITRSAFRVALRLPQILGFTILWTGFLAVIAVATLQISDWMRQFAPRSRTVNVAIAAMLFAEWTLEIGVTTAAYFMLNIMIREKIGPWKAFVITLEISKKEYAHMLGDLNQLRQLFGISFIDSGYLIFMMLTFIGTMTATIEWWPTLGSKFVTTAAPSIEFLAIFAVPAGSVICLALINYLVFQTLQLLLASAVYLYLKDGIMMKGFEKDDFDRVLGLRASGLRDIPAVMNILKTE